LPCTALTSANSLSRVLRGRVSGATRRTGPPGTLNWGCVEAAPNVWFGGPAGRVMIVVFNFLVIRQASGD